MKTPLHIASLALSCASVLGLSVSLTLSAAMPAAAQTHGFDDAERAGIETIVREYLMDNPAIILEAISAHRAREEDEARIEAEAQLYSSQTTPVLGNPDGDVTMVEFFDYNCGYCKIVTNSVATLLEEDPNLRVVMKEYPILGEGSLIAARAALAATGQDAYETMHFALMAHRGGFTEDTVISIATDQGLDIARLRTDMESDWVAEEILQNIQLAQSLGIRGTPAFIVGTDYIPGAAELETLRRVIDDNRSGT